MKDYKSYYPSELLEELSDLKSRAIQVNYKNGIPKLPEPKIYNIDHLMSGFYMRLHNWKNQLLQLENPGGLSVVKSQPSNLNSNSSNFVISSDDLQKISDISTEENL